MGRFASVCVLFVFLAGCEAPSSSNNVITISPGAVFLSTSTVSTVQFTASGGNSNYVWSMSSSSLGTLNAAGSTATYQSIAAGSTATYQSIAAGGTNVITVSDTSGNAATATITQQ